MLHVAFQSYSCQQVAISYLQRRPSNSNKMNYTGSLSLQYNKVTNYLHNFTSHTAFLSHYSVQNNHTDKSFDYLSVLRFMSRMSN
jgi:hypothetical protein